MVEIPIPVNFRSVQIRELTERLRAGESCSVIGVGDTGKSNLVRHLLRADVRQLHFGDAESKIIYLYVDCNKLSQPTEQHLYALILDVLARMLMEMGGDWALLHPRVDDWWQKAVVSGNDAITRHNLEQAFSVVFAAGALQIITAFDDCDALFRQDSLVLLKSLRALRDDFKLRVVYVPVTRREIKRLHPTHTPEFETFFELMVPHVIVVPPYREADALMMLERLAARQDANPRPLSEAEKSRLVQITGGHAGLVRAAYFATRRGERALEPDLVTTLSKQAAIRDECKKIWDCLDEFERGDLIALARRQPSSNLALTRLKKMGLIVENTDGSPAIFSPLLNAYAADQIRRQVMIHLDGKSHTVGVDERTISLTLSEFVVFSALYEKRPAPVSRDDLIGRLMSIKADPSQLHAHPERRLDHCLAQLKSKIDLPGNSYIVVLDKENAVRLVDENGQ